MFEALSHRYGGGFLMSNSHLPMTIINFPRTCARTLLATVAATSAVTGGEVIAFAKSERLQDALDSVTNSAPVVEEQVEPAQEAVELVHAGRLATLETIAMAEGTWNWSTQEIDFTMRFSDRLGAGTLDITKPHPREVRGSRYSYYRSDASGAFQFLSTTWTAINGGRNLPMTPENQLNAAAALARSVGYDFDRDFYGQAYKLASTWASIPTRWGSSYYNQPVKSLSSLTAFYDQRLAVHEAANARAELQAQAA